MELRMKTESSDSASRPRLTPRERQIVRLISLGCTVKEVAAVLGIGRSTVDNHKGRAMNKLGVHKATQLLRIAMKHGYSSVDDKLTSDEESRLHRRTGRLSGLPSGPGARWLDSRVGYLADLLPTRP
jgi:DNA-binding CsgD family transcriptional regulator